MDDQGFHEDRTPITSESFSALQKEVGRLRAENAWYRGEIAYRDKNTWTPPDDTAKDLTEVIKAYHDGPLSEDQVRVLMGYVRWYAGINDKLQKEIAGLQTSVATTCAELNDVLHNENELRTELEKEKALSMALRTSSMAALVKTEAEVERLHAINNGGPQSSGKLQDIACAVSDVVFGGELAWDSMTTKDFVEAVRSHTRTLKAKVERLRAERDETRNALERMTVHASNHAVDAEQVRRERDAAIARADGMERAGAEQAKRADQNQADMLEWRARAEKAEATLDGYAKALDNAPKLPDTELELARQRDTARAAHAEAMALLRKSRRRIAADTVPTAAEAMHGSVVHEIDAHLAKYGKDASPQTGDESVKRKLFDLWYADTIAERDALQVKVAKLEVESAEWERAACDYLDVRDQRDTARATVKALKAERDVALDRSMQHQSLLSTFRAEVDRLRGLTESQEITIERLKSLRDDVLKAEYERDVAQKDYLEARVLLQTLYDKWMGDNGAIPPFTTMVKVETYLSQHPLVKS